MPVIVDEAAFEAWCDERASVRPETPVSAEPSQFVSTELSPPALVRPPDFNANKLWRTIELVYELRATPKFAHATQEVLRAEVSRRHKSEAGEKEKVSLRIVQEAEAWLIEQQHFKARRDR